ncbi:hypothetical protein QFC24_000178 [Naganishia onofrii]|uniref:Uncharacterized protein n=1 Tax=Naganishia onofrii TaxID=1851511 RepID=A0ACC2XW72_9TREE|nr:hypothetical protein QFC24_000178 [Naganishia onofrii]
MAELTTRTHTPPTTNQNNSKNGSSTERSSGTGSGESSTNTPSARKKKGGGLGNHDTASNTGLAGLFASLCGGKKAKKAFDEEPLSSRHTGSRPITGVSQHSGSKAPPAAPVTTKQVSPDIEVTTAKRLSTGETDTSKPTIATAQSPMSSERVADGTANGTQMINGSETNSANQQPGTEGHGIQSSSTDNQNELASNGHVAGSERASGSLAPALIGAAATGVGAAVVSSASGGLNIPQSQDQETGDIGENDNTVNGATQKLNDLHLPNDVIVSTGHPLPLEEPSQNGVGLGILPNSTDNVTNNQTYSNANAVVDDANEEAEQDDMNMYADGLDADDDFMDEEDRLIRQGGIGIPVGPDGKPAPLLPPLSVEHQGRKCLVLDLDETLLHSSFKMIPSADFIVPVEIESQTHNVYVIKRPGVDMFLKAMGEIYEVVVFTASLSKYADPVLDMLDIHKVVKHRLFRESCYNHKGNYVKDLSQLGREIHTSIIIDNSPASYIFHPNNAVPVSTWFNDPHDTELTDLSPFLADLATVDDVRGVLDGQL